MVTKTSDKRHGVVKVSGHGCSIMLAMFNPLDIFTAKRSVWALFLAVALLCAQPADANDIPPDLHGHAHGELRHAFVDRVQFRERRREWSFVVDHIGSSSPPRLFLEYSGDAESRFSIDFAFGTDPFDETGISSRTEFVWRF